MNYDGGHPSMEVIPLFFRFLHLDIVVVVYRNQAMCLPPSRASRASPLPHALPLPHAD